VSADVSELLAYASHIGSSVDRCERDLSRVVERGANNVKRTAIANVRSWSTGTYLKHYPKSIGYDMLGPLEAEVGPDSSKPQGGMGRGVEFGSVHTPPKPHMFPAADVEEPLFEKNVAVVIARSLR
jgi:hypothetical protein